jgi:hypothetical protein
MKTKTEGWDLGGPPADGVRLSQGWNFHDGAKDTSKRSMGFGGNVQKITRTVSMKQKTQLVLLKYGKLSRIGSHTFKMVVATQSIIVKTTRKVVRTTTPWKEMVNRHNWFFKKQSRAIKPMVQEGSCQKDEGFEGDVEREEEDEFYLGQFQTSDFEDDPDPLDI